MHISMPECSYQARTNTDDNSLGCYRLHSIQQTVQQPLLSLYKPNISEFTEMANVHFLSLSKVLHYLPTLGWLLAKMLFYNRENETLACANMSNSSSTKMIVLCASPHSLKKTQSVRLNWISTQPKCSLCQGNYTHRSMAIMKCEFSSNDAWKKKERVKTATLVKQLKA